MYTFTTPISIPSSSLIATHNHNPTYNSHKTKNCSLTMKMHQRASCRIENDLPKYEFVDVVKFYRLSCIRLALFCASVLKKMNELTDF